jgi:hypothetical protein
MDPEIYLIEIKGLMYDLLTGKARVNTNTPTENVPA